MSGPAGAVSFEARKSAHLPSERNCAHPGMTGIGLNLVPQPNIIML
jgi:hypothetical protein